MINYETKFTFISQLRTLICNRWHNILPYDKTRVLIQQTGSSSANNKDEESCVLSNCENRTSYINANHVRVPEAAKHYILTQGPIDKNDQRQRTLSSSMMLMLGSSSGGNARSETVSHFWTMAWQQKSPAIVMLCRTHERDAYGCLQCKCARYWPKSTSDSDIIRLLDLEIRLLEEHALKRVDQTNPAKEASPRLMDKNDDQCTMVRKIEVLHLTTNEKRIVTQYHYQKWPDFGVPEGKEIDNFLRLVSLVDEEYPSTEECPNIIHCSAGVGRSGTFCLVDSCLHRMRKSGALLTQEQVIGTLLSMRRQRMGLIQTDDQLHFALLAISAGANAANEKATSHKNTLDLNSYSTNATGVSSSQNTLKYNSSLSPFQENGDSLEKHEIDNMKSRNIASVDGIKSIFSNGKTRNLDENSSSHKTRKR